MTDEDSRCYIYDDHYESDDESDDETENQNGDDHGRIDIDEEDDDSDNYDSNSETDDQNDDSPRMIGIQEAESVMNGDVKEIAEVLCIPKPAVLPSLQVHEWDENRLTNSFFSEEGKEERTRDAGVYYRIRNHAMGHDTNQANTTIDCMICFDTKGGDDVYKMPCGHAFCTDCWKGFITATLGGGPSCVIATCPSARCTEVLTEEEVKNLAPEFLCQFVKYQTEHYINGKKDLKWCPGPGCDRIATWKGLTNNVQVNCESCRTEFCLGCDNGPHLPLTCDEVKSRVKDEMLLASSETWITEHTQLCPKCNVPIEKNQGCNHMTCSQCRHEFCWICLNDWKGHNSTNCNRYKEGKTKSKTTDKARDSHYYKRYQVHDDAEKFAVDQLKTIQEIFSNQNPIRFGFEIGREAHSLKDEFIKAIEQVIKCRRTLKYTYVYDHYHLHNSDEIKCQRFHYHQGFLSQFTEELSGLTEQAQENISKVELINKRVAVKKYLDGILQHVMDEM